MESFLNFLYFIKLNFTILFVMILMSFGRIGENNFKMRQIIFDNFTLLPSIWLQNIYFLS